MLRTNYSTTAETAGQDGTGATRVRSNTEQDEGGDGWTHILLFFSLLFLFFFIILLLALLLL